MSKVMKIKILDIVDYEPADTTYNHTKYGKFVFLISALDADRAAINGYYVSRENDCSLLNRKNVMFTVYAEKPTNGVREFKNNTIKIKPYICKLYITHREDGKRVLVKKHQRAVLVEDN